MSLRVRRPETIRIALSDGEWILVKKYLTAGEQRAIFRRMMRDGVTGDQIDSVRVGWSKMVGYLLDWSATDPDGKLIAIHDKSEDEIGAALDAMPVDAFKEILNAIEAHEAAMDKAMVQEKNGQGGASELSVTSRSAESTTGDTMMLPISPLISTTC